LNNLIRLCVEVLLNQEPKQIMKLHHLFMAAALAVVACTSQAAPKDWVGKPLPDLAVEYLDKAPDLKGKPAVVEFWATWCPPCRASIPHLNELNKKYKDKGLVIIGISDEDQKKVTEFRKTLPMDYTVAIDKKDLGQKLGVTGIPHAFVVGKDGKVAWQGHPMELTDAEIEKVLK
jgi:thiol-disulfide isomerase/thioredoxin